MDKGERELRPRLFINYRSKDTGTTASALYRDLVAALETPEIFIDHKEIAGGDPWREKLTEEASGADVLISLIGEKWLTLHDGQSGRRLLDEPEDWVRQEIELAIDHDVHLLPILVEEARALERDYLSPHGALQKLADTQAHHLRRKNWETDFEELLAILESKGFHRRTALPEGKEDLRLPRDPQTCRLRDPPPRPHPA